MSHWVKVASVSDLLPGKKKSVRANQEVITLVNVDGNFYALEAFCPHMGAPLAEEGILKGNLLTCGWHGWRFDVCTGRAVRGDQVAKTYPVKVEQNEVYVLVEP